MRNWQSMMMIVAALAATMLNSVATGQCETWQIFGNGLPRGVRDLVLYNGKLIAAGHTVDSGGATELGWIRTWNGPSVGWALFGNEPLFLGDDTLVTSLAIYNGDLIVGGWFDLTGKGTYNGITRWNGSVWQPLGDGVDGSVYALTVYHGDLIAAGYFQNAGGQAANNIARWNGSGWEPLGGGIGDAAYQYISALAVYHGDLYAGGHFGSAGGQSANNIARWNGSQWKPLGSGIGVPSGPYYYPSVSDLKMYQNELIVAGGFSTAGGHDANSVARWNGAAWHAMGSTMSDGSRSIQALAIYNGNLIIAGEFVTAAQYPTPNVARWTGASWQFFGNDLNCVDWCLHADDPSGVFSLAVYNGDLIAGGGFNAVGDSPASNIARWHDCAVCPSDITRDGKVDSADLMAVLNSWGPCQSSKTYNKWYELYLQPLAPASACPADIYPLGGDGRVDHNDLVAILSAWGACPQN